MQSPMAIALLGATYGLLGYSLGKLSVALLLVTWVTARGGNLWALMLVAPALASLALVWMAARGLAGTLGFRWFR